MHQIYKVIEKVYPWILVLSMGVLFCGFDIESSVAGGLSEAMFVKQKENINKKLNEASRQNDKQISDIIKNYPQCSQQYSEYRYKFTINGKYYNMYFKNERDADRLKTQLQQIDRQMEDLYQQIINQVKNEFRGMKNYTQYITEAQNLINVFKRKLKINVRVTRLKNPSYQPQDKGGVNRLESNKKSDTHYSTVSSQWNYESLRNSTSSNSVPYLNDIVKRASNPLDGVFYGGNNSTKKQKDANDKRLKSLSAMTKSSLSEEFEPKGGDIAKVKEQGNKDEKPKQAYDDNKIVLENMRYSQNEEKKLKIHRQISLLNENNPQDMGKKSDLMVESIEPSVENALMDALRKNRELQKTNKQEEQILDERSNEYAPGKTSPSTRATSKRTDTYANNHVVTANNQKNESSGSSGSDYVYEKKWDDMSNVYSPYDKSLDHLPDIIPNVISKQKERIQKLEKVKKNIAIERDSLKFIYDMSILADQTYLRDYDNLPTTKYKKIEIKDSTHVMYKIYCAIDTLNKMSKMDGVINGFSATLYYNEVTGQYVIGCRGSENPTPENFDDWLTNFTQFMGDPTHQYGSAYTLGRLIMQLNEADRQNIVITGHSLGGGLASAIGSISGCKTITFNAAGLSDKTLEHFAKIYAQDNNETNNKDIDEKEIYDRFKNNQNNITAYYSDDDFLSILQEQGIAEAVAKAVETYPVIASGVMAASGLAVSLAVADYAVTAVTGVAVSVDNITPKGPVDLFKNTVKVKKGLYERISYLKNNGIIPKAVGNRRSLGKAGPHTMDNVIEVTKQKYEEKQQELNYYENIILLNGGEKN